MEEGGRELKKILDLIAGEMEKAFRTAGYDPEYA